MARPAAPKPSPTATASIRADAVVKLYTPDNWRNRRTLLFRLIYWKVALATIIIGVALFTQRESSGINSLTQVGLPALLAAIAAELTAYVFGANADDADKRMQTPTPEVVVTKNSEEE